MSKNKHKHISKYINHVPTVSLRECRPHRPRREVEILGRSSSTLGLLVVSEIDSSIRNGNTRWFINKTLSTETTYQQDVINRDRLSTWLMVGKLGQGMRCWKCNSTSNVLVCETQGKVYMYGCVDEWVGSVCVCVCVSSFLISSSMI